MIRAPMARPVEDPLDVGLLAAQRARLERAWDVASLGRLGDSVARPEGQVRLELGFDRAEEGPVAEGRLDATVWLVCQRCLGPFEARIEAPVKVAFVDDDEAAARVSDEYEAVTVDHGRLDLDAYVEDELLLALPLVPMHAAPSACGVQPETVAEVPRPVTDRGPVQRPFADLKGLLKR